MLPTLRTDDNEGGRGGGDDRKFQFIKLLSIRMSSYLRPSYLLFNHPHIFLPSHIDLALFPSFSRTRALRSTCVRVRTHSLSPVYFIVFPPCCTYKARTLLRSHGDVVMLVERMRNALVYIHMHSCEYVWTYIYMRSTGGSSHTSSGGSPSHVLRGENVPLAYRKGR